MPDTQTVVADSSSAETADVFRGENLSLAEYNQYRQGGELPARFKPAEDADSASADTPEETASEGEEPESDPGAEPEEHQETPAQPKKLTAKGRIAHLESTIEELWQQDEPDTVKIAQLTATIDKIERGAGMKRKTEIASVPNEPQSQAQPSSAAQPPRTYKEWEQSFNPEAWIEGYAKQHPEASYERANAAMFSTMLDVREQFRARDEAKQRQDAKLESKVDEARSRYEDFDEVFKPVLTAIVGDKDIPPAVIDMLNESDVLPDVLYVIGSDPEDAAAFVEMTKTNPGKAKRYIALTENLIREERDHPGEDAKEGKTPEGNKTRAPKPPAPVGGSSSRAFDASDESLSPEEWARKRNAQLAKRG